MGKKENSLIEYYNKNQRFAELINGYFFDGKAYLQEEMLSDADRRQEHRRKMDAASVSGYLEAGERYETYSGISETEKALAWKI